MLDYIPAGCFIDRRAFKNTAADYEFLLAVSPEDYAKYHSNIARFFGSDAARMFGVKYVVSVIAEHICPDVLMRVREHATIS